MRNLYSKMLTLSLAAILLTHILQAQVLNQEFISPQVLRQGYAQIMRSAPDGKTYVAGELEYHAERKVKQLVRLHSDGTLDTSFDPEIPNSGILDFEVLADGTLVVVVSRDWWESPLAHILSSSGALITTLDDYEGPTAVEPLPDGGFLLGNVGYVYHFSPTLQSQGIVARVEGDVADIEALGTAFTVAGQFTSAYDIPANTSYPRTNLARYDLDGKLDLSFNSNAAMSSFGVPAGIEVQSDGKVIPLNNYNYVFGSKRSIRLNNDGSVDTEFENNFPSLVIEDASFVDGQLTVTATNRIVRLNANGSVDESFTPITYLSGTVRTLVLPDGSLILGNYAPALYGFAKFTLAGQRNNAYYARLMRYGRILTMERNANSIFIGGDFMKVGNHITKNVARLNLDGTILRKFQNLEIVGPVLTLDAVAGAKVVLNTPSRIYRLESDGRFDASFSFSPIAGLRDISKILVQPDGKILIGGKFRMFRLNANGSRDHSFNATVGISENYSGGIDFDLHEPTGKIVVGMYYYPLPNGISVQQLHRLNADGSTDMSFDAPLDDAVNYGGISKLMVLEDEKVLVLSSEAIAYNGDPYYVYKLGVDGSFDEEFMNNFYDRNTYGWYEHMARFGDRVVMSVVNPYSGTADEHAYYLNGLPDEQFSFPAGVTVPFLDGFYADNATELFIFGEIVAPDGTRPYQLAKFTYPSPVVSGARMIEGSAVSFYPNPAKDFVTVNVEEQSTLIIFDGMGTRRISSEINGDDNTISLNGLAEGKYVIEVISAGKSTRAHFLID